MKDEFTEHHEEIEPEPPLVASDLKRLDVNHSEFQQRLKELKHLEEISSRLGTEKPALQTGQRIMYELQHIADPILARFCAQHVYEWYADSNPHHIDIVMMICDENGIEPTPTIIKLAAKVARSRMTGGPSGTAENLKKENIKRQVFTLMLNLIYAGELLKDAADKAAQWKRDNYPYTQDYKASTLNKEYAQKYRRAGPDGLTTEKLYFEMWNRHGNELRKSEWQKIGSGLPLADEDLIGMRR